MMIYDDDESEKKVIDDVHHNSEFEEEQRDIHLNSKIVLDKIMNLYDPASIVDLQLSESEKLYLLKLNPSQPTEKGAERRCKIQGNRNRFCSQASFCHKGGLRQRWASYSLSADALFCIPCLLFSDELSRGKNWRSNQGHAFVIGFSNWKKQYERV